MRLVIQKVSQAAVTSAAEGKASATAEIGRGLCVLVGFEKDDTPADLHAACKQLLGLRLYPEIASEHSTGRAYAASLRDVNQDLLLVSQFTLNVTLKSGRPSFHRAMGPGSAAALFEQFVALCRGGLEGSSARVRCGVFGSYMQLHMINDGPFTICLTCKDGKCTTW